MLALKMAINTDSLHYLTDVWVQIRTVFYVACTWFMVLKSHLIFIIHVYPKFYCMLKCCFGKIHFQFCKTYQITLCDKSTFVFFATLIDTIEKETWGEEIQLDQEMSQTRSLYEHYGYLQLNRYTYMLVYCDIKWKLHLHKQQS